MLEKIVKISNVGKFKKYNCAGDVSLRKLTLIYAENGRGKTTLCGILRSLQTGRAEFIAERKTLGTSQPASVHLRLNNRDFKFDSDAWKEIDPDIVIFDPVFVNENIYSGDFVQHDHKKNWYRLVVGNEGVQITKTIDDLDLQIRNINEQIRVKKEILSSKILGNLSLEQYLKLEKIEDIGNQIQTKSDFLNKKILATSKNNEIQTTTFLKKILLPSIPQNFETILNKQITDIVDDAESKVRTQILKHSMESAGESWLSQGLTYVKDDKCAFCENDLKENSLIAAYKSHFNESYKKLKDDVATLKMQINKSIGETVLANFQQMILDNFTLVEFWKQFMTVELVSPVFSEIQNTVSSLRYSCLKLARKKEANPSEKVTTDEEFLSALNSVKNLSEKIENYNSAVDSINTKISELKLTSTQRENLEPLKNEIKILETTRNRFYESEITLCQEYMDLVNSKEEREEKKKSKKNELDNYCENTLSTYQNSVNDILAKFGTGFRITESRHMYTGGTPSSHYQIEIDHTAITLGDTETEAGTPCFKTALSSGDKNALALAFFLAVLQNDPKIAEKMVVFDDPFTSLDRFRRTCTQQLIQRVCKDAKQVIILSHDPYFLKLFWDQKGDESKKPLHMFKTVDSTVIGEWDIFEETKNEYFKNYSILFAYFDARRGDPRSVVKSIRPFLEGLYRVRLPGSFADNEWLGEFIGKIRESTTNKFDNLKLDVDELSDINEYSTKYHHDQNPNADSERIDDDELHGFVARTLKLVGCG